MRRFFKFAALFVTAALMAGIFSGCGSSSSKNMINIALGEDPGTADVQKTTAEYSLPLNIFDRLVEAETTSPGKSELVPGLAEKWDISPDGITYTFHLKKGVKFQNGEEFKADDVLFTFDRMLDPKTKALNTDFLDMIAGADDRMNGKATSTSGLKVIDDNTIEIKLTKPFAPFLANLAAPACSIYNRKATTEAGDQFGLDPSKTIGTGPFKFKSWKINDNCVVEANKDYFKGAPKIDGINFKIVPDAETARMLFETGKIDVFDCDNATSQIPYFKKSEKWKNQIVSGPRVGVYYYCLNENIKPLDNVKVRKALQMAIDRQSILDKLYYGEGTVANGIMPPGLLGYNPNLEPIKYDPQGAKALLKEAGFPNGFEMTIAQQTDSSSTLKINEAVQAMLGQIGVKVKIVQMDQASYFATRKVGKLPSYEGSWSADYNDPDNFMYTFFSQKNAVSRSFNYKNMDANNKLEQARTMVDPNQRTQLYQGLEKTIVQQDAAWVPLFSLNHLFVVQPKIKNFKVSWNGWSAMPYYGIEIADQK